jgi:hypothetical protein
LAPAGVLLVGKAEMLLSHTELFLQIDPPPSPARLPWLVVTPGKITVSVTKATECVAFVTETVIMGSRAQLSHRARPSEAAPRWPVRPFLSRDYLAPKRR